MVQLDLGQVNAQGIRGSNRPGEARPMPEQEFHQRAASRRRVIHVGGFDAMSAERFHARFSREHGRFLRCWGLRGEVGELAAEPAIARWTIRTEGPNWRFETEHVLLRWDDIIRAVHARPWLARWRDGLFAGLDFAWHGALLGYLRHAVRYALFFLFPYLALLLAVLAGLAAGGLAARFGGWAPGLLAGLAVAAAGIAILRRKVPLDHLIDDWSFASRHVRALDPAVEERIRLGARLIADTPAEVELLVIGHSLGAALGAEMVAETVTAEPEGRTIRFLTLGSSILKLGLHRRAVRLRAAVETIALSPRVRWIEYQAVNDVMNFFRSDPVRDLKLRGASPLLRKIRFGEMLEPGYYRTIRRNFFRLHCQFVSANDRRAAFDYMMAVTGPVAIDDLAHSREGTLAWYGPDGALVAGTERPAEVA